MKNVTVKINKFVLSFSITHHGPHIKIHDAATEGIYDILMRIWND